MRTEGGRSNHGNTECAEGVQCLKNKAIQNGVAISDGTCVTEEAHHLKSQAMNNGVVCANGNGVTEGDRVLRSKSLNNMVASAYGNGVVEEAGIVKSEATSSEVEISNGFYSASQGSRGLESLRTYKRRKSVKSSSKRKFQEDYREFVETASHIADQVVKEPFGATLGKTADDCANRRWGNVVLLHLYQSLGNDNSIIEGCIRETLIRHPQISRAPKVKESLKMDKDGQEFSSQVDCLSHRTRTEANGHVRIMQNGSSSESHGRGVTDICQRVLCDILASDKFSSLCKVLFENFQGMKPESVFDFSVMNVMNSRMKQQTYEQSPALFLSDIQQVWRKLHDTCNEIVTLTKSLSNMSRNSYTELVGISAESTFEDEKRVEPHSHMKPEQTEECATCKICSCSHCGEKANGTDCLVCDSCEKLYHLFCIEPALKEIPHKSWYCANCTASGIGSPHDNCVVCERLTDAMTPNNIIGDEILPRSVETLNEVEENSNCTYDGIQVPIDVEETHNCKMCGNELDGEKLKICGHPFCPNKYYHERCLTSKLLKSYSHCWYCPSCLCQACLTDQNDDQIVLCDGCDHAYHICCMEPPLTSIPTGKWFCRKCDAGIKAIYRAKRAYENNEPGTGKNVSKANTNNPGKNVSKANTNNEKKCNNGHVQELERGAMDMLLTAVNSLISSREHEIS